MRDFTAFLKKINDLLSLFSVIAAPDEIYGIWRVATKCLGVFIVFCL
jgi:hypothetical protein